MTYIAYLFAFLLGMTALSVSAQNLVASKSEQLPFSLDWTQGRCNRCHTATLLTDLQFVSRNEAWGTGFAPPGETGTGDTTIVHTMDGGKTWIEFPSSYEHNASPVISFANRREGWLMTVQMPEGELRLLQTRNGGSNWKRLTLRDLFVDDIQDLGNGHGHATLYNIYSKSGQWLTTSDYGRHWTSSELPDGLWPGKFRFLDSDHGILTGCMGTQITALVTTNGGRHWKAQSIETPHGASSGSACDFEVDDLNVVDTRNAWLLASKSSYANGEALTPVSIVARTSDGGKTWKPVIPADSPFRHAEVTSVQFLGDRLGFITGVDNSRILEKPPADAKGFLLYTIDGGDTWQKLALPRPVWGCRKSPSGLACAGEEGFWVLKIVQRDKQE